MNLNWVYQIPLWLLVIPVFLLMLLAPMEAGFRLGARQHRAHPDAKEAARGDVTIAAMLTLLGLMLAFTYSFSMSRADLRKRAFTAEVNALSTAFLRADLAAEPGRTVLREHLLNYARSRLVTREMVSNWSEFEKVIERSMEAQSKLWPATRTAVRHQGDMTDPEKALLISAINDVLDAHTSRMAVIFDRIPAPVLALLLLIAASALSMAAYNATLSGHQYRLRLTVFAVILAVLMCVIVDFDFILHGFIRINHESLAALIQEMEASLEP